jgi:hypothetical protein
LTRGKDFKRRFRGKAKTTKGNDSADNSKNNGAATNNHFRETFIGVSYHFHPEIPA